jgi:hypothetical protein
MGRDFPTIRKIADGLRALWHYLIDEVRALWHYLNTSEPLPGTAKDPSLEEHGQKLARQKAIFELRELERSELRSAKASR